jgi:2-dehydro-3-deoxyphosphogluconate aldolase/(4S)-4-hydroxy-2-oxoglutarate aldolase
MGLKMEIKKRIRASGLLPVVEIDSENDAVLTADALLRGGLDVLEIACSTAAAPGAIRKVAAACPGMLLGAGSIITLDQCKEAVDCGASFIVTPGFDPKVVEWCRINGIFISPGCATPTEITMAVEHGLKVIHFLPAEVNDGLLALKDLSTLFGDVKFILSGGVNLQNAGKCLAASFVFAVSGSWFCTKSDIITNLCSEARNAILGFEIAHIGINCENSETSMAVCDELCKVFSFTKKQGSSSNFASNAIEVMKSIYRGEKGHLAVRTNAIDCALAEMEKHGYFPDMETVRYKNGRMLSIYLNREIGGFAVHLVQA